jgi:hypothetical protein
MVRAIVDFDHPRISVRNTGQSVAELLYEPDELALAW